MRLNIKKYICLLCFFHILTISFAQAQPGSIKNHRFGFRIGKNYTIWNPDQVESRCEFDTSIDYSAGFIFLKRWNDQFMINIELLFTGKLFRVEYSVNYNSGLNSYKTSREEIFFIIQVPILLNYKLSGNQQKGVRLIAGPGIGVISRFWLYQGTERFHTIFGVILGSEYQFSHFLIGLRCDFNLNGAYHLNYGNMIISGKMNTISIMFGMIF